MYIIDNTAWPEQLYNSSWSPEEMNKNNHDKDVAISFSVKTTYRDTDTWGGIGISLSILFIILVIFFGIMLYYIAKLYRTIKRLRDKRI